MGSKILHRELALRRKQTPRLDAVHFSIEAAVFDLPGSRFPVTGHILIFNSD